MTTSERLCVYTVLTKGFEDLLDQPVAEQSNVDFICFSDDPSIISNTWMIRPLELMFTQDPARSSRLAKLCAHRVLPEYDISLYIDNSVRLRRVPEAIVDELLPADVGFAALSHAYRDSIEDEFRAIGDKVEAQWVLEEQIVHYRIAHPEILKRRPDHWRVSHTPAQSSGGDPGDGAMVQPCFTILSPGPTLRFDRIPRGWIRPSHH